MFLCIQGEASLLPLWKLEYRRTARCCLSSCVPQWISGGIVFAWNRRRQWHFHMAALKGERWCSRRGKGIYWLIIIIHSISIQRKLQINKMWGRSCFFVCFFLTNSLFLPSRCSHGCMAVTAYLLILFFHCFPPDFTGFTCREPFPNH